MGREVEVEMKVATREPGADTRDSSLSLSRAQDSSDLTPECYVGGATRSDAAGSFGMFAEAEPEHVTRNFGFVRASVVVVGYEWKCHP